MQTLNSSSYHELIPGRGLHLWWRVCLERMAMYMLRTERVTMYLFRNMLRTDKSDPGWRGLTTLHYLKQPETLVNIPATYDHMKAN